MLHSDWPERVAKESRGRLSSEDLNWSPDFGLSERALEVDQPGTFITGPESTTAYLVPSMTSAGTILTMTAEDVSFSLASPFSTETTPAHNAAYADRQTVHLLGGSLSLPHSETQDCVDILSWDHTGAGATTQIGLALLSLDAQLSKGNLPNTIFVSIRGDFLAEIAKLRALRICLAHLGNLFSQDWNPAIVAAGSVLHLSAHDQRNNLVRLSLSAAAAILGGADHVSLPPWNAQKSGYSDTEAARLSENVFRLLCYESYLDQVEDPLSGSHSIESLTNSFVNAAWDAFISFKDVSPSDLSARLLNEVLPRDREQYRSGGRNSRTSSSSSSSSSSSRVIVGETHFLHPDPPLSEALAPPLFPLIENAVEPSPFSNWVL